MKLSPLNLRLYVPDSKFTSNAGEVTSLNIFISSSRSFHPEGLFSTETFGQVGSKERSRRFGFIRTNQPVLHPLIFKKLVKSKALYKSIMQGNSYAVFDESINDFIAAPMNEGETGYSFFMKHVESLQLPTTGSKTRDITIEFLERYKESYTFDNLIVIPANLRDYIVDDNGKPSEDGINDLYRKVLRLTNLIPRTSPKNDTSLEVTRYNLQLAILEIYEYIENLYIGKYKLLNKRVATRSVFYGSSNVLTSLNVSKFSLGMDQHIKQNEITVGLYQFIQSIAPLAKYHIRHRILDKVFPGDNMDMNLVDKKTLLSALVEPDKKLIEKWTTDDGLLGVINSFADENIRNNILEFKDYYFALLYMSPKTKEFMVLHSIADLPDHLEKRYVKPITFAELLTLSVYHLSDKVVGTQVRFPVENRGSVNIFESPLRVTSNFFKAYPLDINGNRTGEVILRYPDFSSSYHNSVSTHPNKIAPMNADFDGDKVNVITAMSKEAVKEAKDILSDKSYYVTSDRRLVFSASNDINKLVLQHLTQTK